MLLRPADYGSWAGRADRAGRQQASARVPVVVLAHLSSTREALLVPGPAPDVTEIHNATLQERDALDHLNAARANLALAIEVARRAGASYDDLARTAVRARIGRAPTVAERRTEAQRLRQLHCRAIRRHANRPASPSRACAHEGHSAQEVSMPSLIKRTTTTVEEFEAGDDMDATEDADEGLGEGDRGEEDGHDDEGEDDDKPDAAASGRRAR